MVLIVYVLQNWTFIWGFCGCQESLASQEVTTETAILHESDLWEEKERLQKEKARLKEQKNNFEKERKNFTDAAIRLSKEVPPTFLNCFWQTYNVCSFKHLRITYMQVQI